MLLRRAAAAGVRSALLATAARRSCSSSATAAALFARRRRRCSEVTAARRGRHAITMARAMVGFGVRGHPNMFNIPLPKILERTSVGLFIFTHPQFMDNFFLDMNGDLIHQCIGCGFELAVLTSAPCSAKSSRDVAGTLYNNCARAACSTSRRRRRAAREFDRRADGDATRAHVGYREELRSSASPLAACSAFDLELFMDLEKSERLKKLGIAFRKWVEHKEGHPFNRRAAAAHLPARRGARREDGHT